MDPASVSKEWKCARCKANAMTEVGSLHQKQRTSLCGVLLLATVRKYLCVVVGWDLITRGFCRIAVYVR